MSIEVSFRMPIEILVQNVNRSVFQDANRKVLVQNVNRSVFQDANRKVLKVPLKNLLFP